jgi:hypothetical protein
VKGPNTCSSETLDAVVVTPDDEPGQFARPNVTAARRAYRQRHYVVRARQGRYSASWIAIAPMLRSMTTGKLAVFGDSIANGMGARGRSYGELIADSLGLELVDFTGTAMPVTESLKALISSDTHPNIAMIAHGITEAILRPSKTVLRYMPPRWRRTGWMDPRPYFSSRPRRGAVERVESALRWRVKNLLLRVSAPVQVLPLDVYVTALRSLVAELQARGARVVILGPSDIDRRFFPGSDYELARYADAAQELGVEFISLEGRLLRWEHYCEDHFHPNDAGHALIAELLSTRLRA